MILRNFSVDKSCEYLLIAPEFSLEENLFTGCQDKKGKEILGKLTGHVGLWGAQVVASAVAIPFQILAGIFSCINQWTAGNWHQGMSELGLGVATAGAHALVAVVASVAVAVGSVFTVLTSPYLLAKWNQQVHIPSPQEIREHLIQPR